MAAVDLVRAQSRARSQAHGAFRPICAAPPSATTTRVSSTGGDSRAIRNRPSGATSKPRTPLPLQDEPRRSRLQPRPGRDGHGHQATAVPVEQLAAIGRPTRHAEGPAPAPRPRAVGTSLVRHLSPWAGSGEGLDVDLQAAGFVRGVREPAPVGRQHGIPLVEGRPHDGSRLAVPVHRERPDVPAVGRVLLGVEDVAAIARPVRGGLVVLGGGQPLDARAGVEGAQVEVEVPVPVRRPGEAPAVGGPHGRDVLVAEGDPRRDVPLEVDQPQVVVGTLDLHQRAHAIGGEVRYRSIRAAPRSRESAGRRG